MAERERRSTQIEREELFPNLGLWPGFWMPAARVFATLLRFHGAETGYLYRYGIKSRGYYYHEDVKRLMGVKPERLEEYSNRLYSEMGTFLGYDDMERTGPLAVGIASLFLVPHGGERVRKHFVMIDGDGLSMLEFWKTMKRIEQEFCLNHFVVMVSTPWNRFHGVFVYGVLEKEWLGLMPRIQDYVRREEMWGVDISNIEHQTLDNFGILRVSRKRGLDGRVTAEPRLLLLNRCHYVVRRVGLGPLLADVVGGRIVCPSDI